MKKNKAIFLDRDGVVNDMLFDETGHMHSPRRLDDFKIKNGIAGFVVRAKKLGYLVIVITSQPEIKRGLISLETMESMHSVLKSELDIDDIFVCLHDNEDNCECRKPKPGMLHDAAEKWNIDLGKSFMIGDTHKDVGAGSAAGCTTILIDTDYNKDAKPDMRVESIQDVLEFI
jgi:D-glycero-D-manno-heptose 1,7-bisphosphate phosphatase